MVLCMMDSGGSVFQGAGSLVIENATQGQEEEEFLAEEQNRKAELENVMKTAFDDLEDDDDESSITSSHYSSRHDFHPNRSLDEGEESSCNRSFRRASSGYQNRIQKNFAHDRLFRQSPGGKPLSSERIDRLGYETPPSSDPSAPYQNVRVDLEVVTEAYKQTDTNSYEQLQVLYDIRMREIERLRKDVEAEQRCKDQILRKLAISETEKQALVSSLNDNQSLLAETSEKVSSLKREITALQEDLKQVSKEKDETKHELDIAKFQILHQEQQIALLEKCSTMNSRDKHIDSIVESLTEKHKKETCSLRKELDDARIKIQQKEEAYKLLESRLDEVEKKHVAVLLSKCDSTVRQEAAVKAVLDDANSEKIQLTKKVRSLEADIEALSKDLEFYESLSKNRLLSSTSSGELEDEDARSPAFRRRGGDHKSHNNIDLLKSELNRALMGQKEKRLTIRKLQEQVQSKEIQIAQMREQEKIYLAETEKLKTDMANILDRVEKGADEIEKRGFLEKIDRLEELISDLNKGKQEEADRAKQLEKEVEVLRGKLAQSEEAAKKLVEEYMSYREQEIAQLKRENEELASTSELEWRNRVEHLLNECDEIKRLYLEIRSDRDLTAQKLEEEKQKHMDVAKTNRALEERIKELKQQVSDLEDHILSIEEEKDDLLRQVSNRSSGQRKSIESYRVKQLKEEIEVLKRQPVSHIFDPADLEKLRDEVAAARKRYLDLESTLKTEFEANVMALKADNDRLKTELQRHEMKLKELRDMDTQTDEVLQVSSAISPVPSNMASVQNFDPTDSRRSEDLEKLQSELERLRAIEIRKHEEIMELKSSFQQRLHEKIEELESKLVPKGHEDVEQIKEQVKNVTAQYYINEMAKLRETFKAELEALNLQKDEELKKCRLLHSELLLKQQELQAVENLRSQLAEQQNTIQEVKTRTALIITNCAKEFEELKSEKEALDVKLKEVAAKSEKYKQSALKYKGLFEKIKMNDLPQKYQRLVALVQSKESEITNKIQEVAEQYRIQSDAKSSRNPTPF